MPNLVLFLDPSNTDQVQYYSPGLFQITLTADHSVQNLTLNSVIVNFTNANNVVSMIGIDSDLFAHGNIYSNMTTSRNLLIPIEQKKQTSVFYSNYVFNDTKIPLSFNMQFYYQDNKTPLNLATYNIQNIILTFNFIQNALF